MTKKVKALIWRDLFIAVKAATNDEVALLSDGTNFGFYSFTNGSYPTKEDAKRHIRPFSRLLRDRTLDEWVEAAVAYHREMIAGNQGVR